MKGCRWNFQPRYDRDTSSSQDSCTAQPTDGDTALNWKPPLDCRKASWPGLFGVGQLFAPQPSIDPCCMSSSTLMSCRSVDNRWVASMSLFPMAEMLGLSEEDT